MDVARHNVAELWIQSQVAGQPSAPGANALARRADASPDLVNWVDRSGVSAGRLVAFGFGLATAGALGALVLPGLGFFATVALGSMFTVGGGMAFLGLRKLMRGATSTADPATLALPPARQSLMAERGRRLRAVLEEGPTTFERIASRLRWTETAVLETLVFMKEAGTVVEDLDLDTGEWIYRLQDNDYGTAEGMSLDERRALANGRSVDRETTA